LAVRPTTVLMEELEAYHASWQLSHSFFSHRKMEDFMVDRLWPAHRHVEVTAARYQSDVTRNARSYVSSRAVRGNVTRNGNMLFTAGLGSSGGGEGGSNGGSGHSAVGGAAGVRVLSASPGRWEESRAVRRGRNAAAPNGGRAQHTSVREARRWVPTEGGTGGNNGHASAHGAGGDASPAVVHSSVREAMSEAREGRQVTSSYVRGATPVPIPVAGSQCGRMVPIGTLVATATARASMPTSPGSAAAAEAPSDSGRERETCRQSRSRRGVPFRKALETGGGGNRFAAGGIRFRAPAAGAAKQDAGAAAQ
jgi:hypothetical protein